MIRTSIGLVLAVIFFTDQSYGQTKITGKIIDASDSTVVSFASVAIYQYQSNKILSYAQTDIEGFYNLEINAKLQVITLKTSHLSYHPYQQDIVIGSDQSRPITLDVGLSPKVEELQAVIIRGPIIVKDDTIIYDVEHWTAARDQTLEEVLAKIPGFKIRADGEIEVNGKKIDKVLIDGEEVTNSGARILIRSIAPENVESVEVRLDEKNDKLKESLLDPEEYAVLDIKLKEGVNKSLFGKIRATLGYQNDAELGGYFNAFSLKRKYKAHLFAEHDRFGEQTLSLDQIKNIGAEALSKLFESSADFQVINKRQAFHDQIYGFKNYTTAHKDIVGLTSRYTLSPYTDLYFGSYNAYTKNEKTRHYSQEVNGGDRIYEFAESQQVTDYSSKNKLELRLDKGNVKARLSVNAVIFNRDYQNPANGSSENRHYRYADGHESTNLYENLFIEYTPSSKFGVRGIASYSSVHSDHAKNLMHNDSLYRSFLLDENNNLVFHFSQNTFSKASSLVSEITSQYKSPIGVVNFGLRFQDRVLNVIKNGNNRDNTKNIISVPLFAGTETRLTYSKWTPFLKHHIALGAFTFRNELGFSQITYPDQENVHKSIELVEFTTRTSFNPYPFFDISVDFSRQISLFPLRKIVRGYDLTGFQSIAIPHQTILKPTPEYTSSIYVRKKFDALGGLLFEPSIHYGRIQNSDRYLFDDESAIVVAYDQLKSEYWMAYFTISKSFKKIPLEISLQPDWGRDQIYNITPSGKFYRSFTSRSTWEFDLKTVFDNKPYDFLLNPNYAVFSFENEHYRSKHRQEMFSVDFTGELDLFNERLLISPTLRAVTFFGNANSDFTNISLKIEAPSAKFRWYFIIDNLLNNTGFTTQTIYPTYFTSENNSVFERYIKFGAEFKFN